MTTPAYIKAEAEALRASQRRARIARQFFHGKATLADFRQARQDEKAAHDHADEMEVR